MGRIYTDELGFVKKSPMIARQSPHSVNPATGAQPYERLRRIGTAQSSNLIVD